MPFDSAGIGLNRIDATTFMPDMSAALSFDSGARGRGIGLAQVPPPIPAAIPQEPIPTAADQATAAASIQATPPAPQENESYYDFQNHPMRSIGRVLGEFSAGYQGKPSPKDAQRTRQLEEQKTQFTNAGIAMDAASWYMKAVQAHPEDVEVLAKDAFNRFGPLGIDLRPLLKGTASGEIKNASAVADVVAKLGSPMLAALFATLAGSNPALANELGGTLTKSLIEAGVKSPETKVLPKDSKLVDAAGNTLADNPSAPELKTSVVDGNLVDQATGRVIFSAPKELSPSDRIAAANSYNTQMDRLRSEFVISSKNYVATRDAFNRIEEAGKTIEGKTPTPVSDLAIVFGYMKMLDPQSVVREGEQATATTAPGVPNEIRQWYNQTIGGNLLLPDRRKDILDASKRFYETQQRQQKGLETEYRRLAKSTGIKSEDVIVNYDAQIQHGATALPPPPPGISPEAWKLSTPEERALWQKP